MVCSKKYIYSFPLKTPNIYFLNSKSLYNSREWYSLNAIHQIMVSDSNLQNQFRDKKYDTQNNPNTRSLIKGHIPTTHTYANTLLPPCKKLKPFMVAPSCMWSKWVNSDFRL